MPADVENHFGPVTTFGQTILALVSNACPLAMTHFEINVLKDDDDIVASVTVKFD